MTPAEALALAALAAVLVLLVVLAVAGLRAVVAVERRYSQNVKGSRS